MPWFPTNTPRKKLEERATLQDVMGAMRVVLNHAGGFASTLANMALSLSRLDARVEAIATDVAALRLAAVPTEDQGVPDDVRH